MLKIDNIANSKDLDRAEMEAITGGTNIFPVGGNVFQNNGINANAQVGGVSFASPQTNVAPVTQVDASQHTNVDLKNITESLTSVGSALGGVKL
ncbi:hypothetical protein [Caballeronia insecticola]|uniref:Uncharacterized protein n=1 Tax=Caballeronia insecticola TaxID=758793 RepID=R4WT23_9BURK|nr:hypothetical protein [Caballeronia insecticola]BAN27732.1 putative uncharacterized protein [Caballeronia insecticola]BAN27733.1 putative uncharacterized protein [Caballeronia insecticola]SAL11883.1 hypothetical protein AWB71_00289 [Caballeronia peredens]